MEGIKIDQMYLENLDEWVIEENKVVTYKFLSRSLNVHVNTAKQMLWNYVQTKQGACKGIVYLVSGQASSAEGGGSVVSLVREAELQDTLARLERVHSQHVYSVQLNETINAASLYATDLEVFKADPFSSCEHSAITNRAAVAREAVAPPKVAPGVQMERVRPAEVKKAGGIENAFAKVARKPSDDQPAKAASVKTEAKPKRSPEKKSQSASAASSGSKKPAGGIANFFAAQAARPKVEKVKVEEESKDTKGEEKENIVNNQKNKEVVTKEKPAKALVKKPTTKKAETKSFGKKDKEETEDGKKRKRIQVMSDSEEERSEGEQREEREEEAPPQAKIIESDSEDEVIPATPVAAGGSARPGRRRVRRQVDKTYVDSDGFMVTKKVVESGSETDEEKPEEVKKKQEPKKVVEEAKASPAKKAKLAVKPAVKKQGGIQSFFTKKT